MRQRPPALCIDKLHYVLAQIEHREKGTTGYFLAPRVAHCLCNQAVVNASARRFNETAPTHKAERRPRLQTGAHLLQSAIHERT